MAAQMGTISESISIETQNSLETMIAKKGNKALKDTNESISEMKAVLAFIAKATLPFAS